MIGHATLIAAGSLAGEPVDRMHRAPRRTQDRYLFLEIVRARHEVDALLPPAYRRAIDELSVDTPTSSSAQESARRALSAEPLPAPPWWAGELDLRPRRGGASRQPRPDHGDPARQSPAGGDRNRLADLLAAPLGNRSPLTKRVRSSRKAPPGAGAAKDAPPGMWSLPCAPQVRQVTAQTIPVGGQVVLGHRYPEWDYRRRAYREDWCSVGEFDPALVDDPVIDGTAPDLNLIRAMARIGLGLRARSGEEVGDEVDLAGLVDYHVDLHTGRHDGVPRVYRSRRRTRSDLGVLIALDATGSGADLLAGASMFEAHRRLVSELTSAFEAVGARVGTYAFYSRGRHNVRFLQCKSFDEPWSLRAQQRLHSVRPAGFTRLGAAIRHGTHQLVTRAGTGHRLLVTVGDGIAYDDGYEGDHAVADCRRAVAEARANAVACVALSAVPTPGNLSVWHSSMHRVTPDRTALTRELPPLLAAALTRATQQPRREELL